MDRARLVGWYQRNRARTRGLFDLIEPAAYYTRPISLRNPIVFYEGHLPAFSVIAYLKRGLGRDGVDERLEELFARGIDPETEAAAVPRSGASTLWPSRDEVLAYAARADAAVIDALQHAPLSLDDRPALRRGQGLFTALEHEAMHQETLLYMWHQLPHDVKRRPAEYRPLAGGAPPPAFRIEIPEGRARLGADPDEIPFGWDNEFHAHDVHVPAFAIDAHNVTNQDYLAFVESGGDPPPFWRKQGRDWYWRGMFEDLPLPPAWPVYVTKDQAEAYARSRGGRLMTEPEFHRAAYGDRDGRERPQPWGSAPPDATRGNFDWLSYEPMPVGSFPQGTSAFGVHDLVGNGWEWTATPFAPFPGFEPMAAYPEYSADFFDGQHFVMKGASPVTARELVRRSFRNWFRPNYPYVYGTFRCVW